MRHTPGRLLCLLVITALLSACATRHASTDVADTTPTPLPSGQPETTPPTSAGAALAHAEAVFSRFQRLMRDWPDSQAEAQVALRQGLVAYVQGLPDGLNSLAQPEWMAALESVLKPHNRFLAQPIYAVDLDNDQSLELIVAVLPVVEIASQAGEGALHFAELAQPRYWPVEETWPNTVEVLDLTGDGRREILLTFTFPGASHVSGEVIVAAWTGHAWTNRLHLPLSGWAGASSVRIDAATTPPSLETTCTAFGIFDAKLVEHPHQRDTYRWDGLRFAWELSLQDEPANLRQRVNVLEAGLRLGRFAEVLEAYRALALEADRPGEARGATAQGQPDWIAFAALRAGQIHALLGQRQQALDMLALAEAAESTIGRLARTFQEVYDGNGDAAAAWTALLYDDQIYEEAMQEQGNLVSFPGNPLDAIYPGMALAAVLNQQPEVATAGPDALRAAWLQYGLQVGHLLTADFDSDGVAEIVVVQPLPASPHSTPAYLLDRGESGWFAVLLGELPTADAPISGPLPVPGEFFQAVQVGDLVRAWQGSSVIYYRDRQSWLLDRDPRTLCPVRFHAALTPAGQTATPQLPMPTPTPSAVSAPDPADALPEPAITAPMLRFHNWSPDNETVAFWTFSEEEAAAMHTHPPGRLHFLNARTGRHCPYPGSAPYRHSFGQSLAWLPDGRAVIFGEGETRLGTPCQDDFTQVSEIPGLYGQAADPSLSPGGSYRAHTTSAHAEDGAINAVTTIQNTQTGEIVETITWRHRGGLGDLGLGGRWLLDHLFLIHETVDEGPLLLHVGQTLLAIAPDLFGVGRDPADGVTWIARGAAVNGAGDYHIVLAGIGLEGNFPAVLLYHAESGQVESLPFHYLGSPAFSPDGRWLILEVRPIRDGYETVETWLRPVDPPGSQARRLSGANVATSAWAPDWSKVAASTAAGLTVLSVPGGVVLGTWNGGPYHLQPAAWSPDGRFLLISAGLRHGRGEALFLIAP